VRFLTAYSCQQLFSSVSFFITVITVWYFLLILFFGHNIMKYILCIPQITKLFGYQINSLFVNTFILWVFMSFSLVSYCSLDIPLLWFCKYSAYMFNGFLQCKIISTNCICKVLHILILSSSLSLFDQVLSWLHCCTTGFLWGTWTISTSLTVLSA
jgi:hypothetical protein